jgi:hypothetical protein
MSFTATDYRHEINLNDTWHKFDSPGNLQRILSFLEEAQWLPSQVTINRAIAHLQLPRTDGGSARKDANEFKRQAQANFEAACAVADAFPFSPQELREFSALSFADLQRKYWAEDGDFFRVRYNKAAREFGFVIPPKPAPPVVEDEGTIRLTAAEYHSMSAQTILQRMRNPKFKLAVMKLVAAREI